MKNIIGLSLICVIFSACAIHVNGDGKVLDHKEWTNLVSKHVDADGLVDYKGMIKDSAILNSYLAKVSANAPAKKWNDTDKIAYWLNAYNAFTVKLIIDNYPVKTIKELGADNPIIFVNTAWDKKFFKIDGKDFTLNDIEQRILRKNFNEPRIHFALNCASMSCPKLRKEAYIGSKLDAQLTDQSKTFLADDNRNKISKTDPKVSAIFDFYTGDFTKGGTTLREYINQYSAVQINDGAKITYLDYDWSLNEQGKKFQ